MISDVEIKSHQPTLADTGAQLAAKTTRALTRPRCICAGIPGEVPDGVNPWSDRAYRKRWISGDAIHKIYLGLGAMLERGDLAVDFLLDLRGLYETESFSARTIEGIAPDENVVIHGGVRVSAVIQQRNEMAIELVANNPNAARPLDYHAPDWLMSGFQSAASHELRGGLDGSGARVAWAYREGLTMDAIDDAMPVRLSVEIDPKNIDYDKPVLISISVYAYTADDSGLLDTPRFADDKGDDLPHDDEPGQEGRPEPDFFSIWLLGFSAWARS